jgi:3-oxoadipate enol-lactonase
MWTAKAATVAETRVPYLDAGDAHSPHVVVLLHAFPVGMRLWEQVSPPAGWRAIAPALPGFDGADPPPSASTSIDDYASAVIRFLNHLRIDSAVLGGLSMGGYVSLALWRMERLRWRALVLADTRAAADSPEARGGREKMLELLKARGAQGIADEMIPKLLGETTRSTRPDLVDHVRRLTGRQTTEGIAGALVRLRDRPDSTRTLQEVGVPTLIVVGDEDVVTPAAESESMAGQLEDARLVRIPAAGHLSCLEQPAAFNAVLGEFLSGIRR